MPVQRRTPRLSPWGRLVAVSGLVLLVCLVGLSAWALASRESRIADFAVRGDLDRLELDVESADVEIVRGADRESVGVTQTDRYTFGHRAVVRRATSPGTFRIMSRCPKTLLRTCRATFRLVVPDNVAIDVRTTSGDVRMRGYRGSATIATRSGSIDVESFCGFLLRAQAVSGDVDAAASCATPQVSLRSTSGDVRAVVPAGRYEVQAESAGGSSAVTGVEQAPDAPFAVQALSSSGDVIVEAGP